MIFLIAAVSKNYAIGKEGKLPWHFETDLKNFRNLTMGNVLVFGRKTYESLEKKLSGRNIIILTRNRDYKPKNVKIEYSYLDIVKKYLKSKDKCFIAGGEEIYTLFINYVDYIYLTEIEKEFDGDKYFPKDKLIFFSEISCKEVIENGVILRFKLLKRTPLAKLV